MIDFRNAIENEGMTPPSNIEPGKLHRFPGAGKGDSNRAGYCLLFSDGLGGIFGDWSTGFSATWKSAGTQYLTPHGWSIFDASVERARQEAAEQREATQAEAAQSAMARWESASPAPEDHPYLIAKGVKSHGLRYYEGGKLLLIPIYAPDGSLTSYQTIAPDGEKRLMKGGRKKGCAFTIDGDAARTFVVEGYATGASVHEATGCAVVVAIDAGNLLPVVEGLIEKGTAHIIIACDNDHGKEPNVGIETAKAICAKYPQVGYIIPPAINENPTDWNDYVMAHGLGAARTLLLAAPHAVEPNAGEEDSPMESPAPESKPAPANANEWQAPILFERQALPTIPLDPFPDFLGDMIRATSDFAETPPELAALIGLGVVACATQGKIKIEVKPGYQEPLSGFFCPVLESGNRKTAVLQTMTAPLSEWEREKMKELQPDIDKANSERKTMEARIADKRNKTAKLKDSDEFQAAMEEITRMEEQLPALIIPPRLFTQDVTPERLASLMADHNQRMALFSDEAGIFATMGGRYSKGVPNLDIFLQGHAGGPVRVDRGSRPPVHMNAPALTMAISPQPQALSALGQTPEFRGRGLLARIIFALPASPLGNRKHETDPIPESVTAAYHSGINALLDTESPDKNDPDTAHVLYLSAEAQRYHLEFTKKVETQLRDGGKFEHIRDWGGKLPGAVARIAGLLHCAKYPHEPWGVQVSDITVRQAIRLMNVLEDHALAVFELMGADPDIEGAKRIWRWIERGRFPSFTKRDAFHDLQSYFHKTEAMTPALKILIDRYVIREIPGAVKVGRPSHAFEVNPALTAGW